MSGGAAAAIPIIARDMIPTKNARNRGSFTRWLWSAFRRVADSDSDRGRSNAGVSSTSATEAASPGGGGRRGGRGRLLEGRELPPALLAERELEAVPDPAVRTGPLAGGVLRRARRGEGGRGGGHHGDPDGFDAGARVRTSLPQYQKMIRPAPAPR